MDMSIGSSLIHVSASPPLDHVMGVFVIPLTILTCEEEEDEYFTSNIIVI